MHPILDERAGIPSATDFERLLACPASARMVKYARATGQEAHLYSKASLRGTAQHLAFVEGSESLSDQERAEWELVKEEVEAGIAEWLDPNGPEPQFYFEERLWFSRYGKLIFSGQPDLLAVQGVRGLLYDYKFGRYPVATPENNLQQTIYAILVQRKHGLKEVRSAIASPFYNYPHYDWTARELRRASRQVVLALKSFEEAEAAGIILDPIIGEQCQFCPGRLVCPAARAEADVAAIKPIVLPDGEQGARLLTAVERASALFKEIKLHYKELLKIQPDAVPGWELQPGYFRRSIPDLTSLVELMTAEGVDFQTQVKCMNISVPEIQEAWAKVKGIPVTKSKEPLKKLLGTLLIEKQNEPFLKPRKNHQMETILRKALLK